MNTYTHRCDTKHPENTLPPSVLLLLQVVASHKPTQCNNVLCPLLLWPLVWVEQDLWAALAEHLPAGTPCSPAGLTAGLPALNTTETTMHTPQMHTRQQCCLASRHAFPCNILQ